MIKKIEYIILIILFSALLSGCQSAHTQPKATDGLLNLSGWDFNQYGIVCLDGDWEFYRQQLLTPGDSFSSASLTGYYKIPGYWTGYQGLSIPSKSYATYRLRVNLDSGKQLLSISLPDLYTEYCLWINGKSVGSNLSIGTKDPRYLTPKTYEIYTDNSQLDIVLQVKNSRHIYAGIGQSILLGSPSSIHHKQEINFALDFFLIGICLIAGLYHLSLFALRRKTKESLYFGILCLSVGSWTMFFNETLIMRLFPYMSFTIGSKLVTLTIPLCVIAITLYTQALYREDISVNAVRLISAINLLYAVMVVLCKPYTYLKLFTPYLFTVGLVSIFGIYIAIKVAVRKRPEYVYYLSGIICLAIGAIINIVQYLQIADTFYCLPYSVAIFIFIQTLLIGKRYIKATQSVNLLTTDLQHSLHRIEDTETAFLNAQIKPHFLYNTLNTIAQCCQSDPEEAEELIIYLSKYLRGTLGFENLGNVIPLKKELELVSAYYHIEKSRFNNIQMEFHVDEALRDCSIPPLILQPLVENAIKHGIRNKESEGRIILEISRLEASILFTVEDNGSGIDEELLPKLLTAPGSQKSIGLYNINTRLIRLYGKGLSVQSTKGTGTKIQFEIPI